MDNLKNIVHKVGFAGIISGLMLSSIFQLSVKAESTPISTKEPREITSERNIQMKDTIKEDKLRSDDGDIELIEQELSVSMDEADIAVSGDMPEAAEVVVSTLDDEQVETAEKLVEELTDDRTYVETLGVYDIKVLDAEGEEFQPEDYDNTLNVKFSGLDVELGERERLVIYHIKDEDKIVEMETDTENIGDVVSEASCDTESFSWYLVGKEYVEDPDVYRVVFVGTGAATNDYIAKVVSFVDKENHNLEEGLVCEYKVVHLLHNNITERYREVDNIEKKYLVEATYCDEIPTEVFNARCSYGYYPNLKRVRLPANITGIGNEAFNQCASLSEVNFEELENLKTIGASAFANTGLEGVIDLSKSSLTTISRNCFRNTKITKVILPNTVTSIGAYAFSGCTELEEFYIPEGCTIADTAFDGYYGVTPDPNDNEYTLASGSYETTATYESSTKTLTIHANNSQKFARLVDMPINELACADYVEHITTSDIKEIRDSLVCTGMKNLKTIDLGGVEETSSFGFGFKCEGCENLETVIYPAKTSSFSFTGFKDCSKLEPVLPSGYAPKADLIYNAGTIDNMNVTRLELPSNVYLTKVENCKNLTYFSAPKTCSIVNCPALEEINISSNDVSNNIGNSGYLGLDCPALKKVTLTNVKAKNPLTIGGYIEYSSSIYNDDASNTICSIGNPFKGDDGKYYVGFKKDEVYNLVLTRQDNEFFVTGIGTPYSSDENDCRREFVIGTYNDKTYTIKPVEFVRTNGYNVLTETQKALSYRYLPFNTINSQYFYVKKHYGYQGSQYGLWMDDDQEFYYPYSADSVEKWKEIISNVEVVRIEDGVEFIPIGFNEAKNLTDLYIGDDVKKIASNTFVFCDKLNNIHGGKNVEVVSVPSDYSNSTTQIVMHGVVSNGVTRDVTEPTYYVTPSSDIDPYTHAFIKTKYDVDTVLDPDASDALKSYPWKVVNREQDEISEDGVITISLDHCGGKGDITEIYLDNVEKNAYLTLEDAKNKKNPIKDIPIPRLGNKVFKGYSFIQNSGIPDAVSQSGEIYSSVKKLTKDATVYAIWIDDRWGFSNSESNYGSPSNGYAISGQAYQRLISCLTPVLADTMAEELNVDLTGTSSEWGGSCYGMSSSTIAVNDNKTPITAYGLGENINNLNSVLTADDSYHSGNRDTVGTAESVINYYHFQQLLPEYQAVRAEFDALSMEEQVKRVATLAKTADERPALVDIWWKEGDEKKGHSIIATGYRETTPEEKINATYPHCILTYDCSHPEEGGDTSDFNIYFNDNGEWTVPGWGIDRSNAYMICGSNDPEIVNPVDYATGAYNSSASPVSSIEVSSSCHSWRLDWQSGSSTEQQSATFKDGILINQSGPDRRLTILPKKTDAAPSDNVNRVILPKGNKYVIGSNDVMDHSILIGSQKSEIKSNNPGTITYENGEINAETTGKGIDARIVSNNSPIASPKIEVEATSASELSIKRADKGYYIDGNDLTDITISEEKNGKEIKVSVSTDSKSILVEDGKNGETSIHADEDGDGVYESEIKSEEKKEEEKKHTIVVGQKINLRQTCFADVTDTISRYVVSNTSLAGVSKEMLSGKKPGTVTVYAQKKISKNSIENIAECEVTILNKPKLKFTKNMTYVDQTVNGSDFFLTEDIRTYGATYWESNKPGIVEVTNSENGTLKAKSSGTAKITAYFGEKGKPGTFKISANLAVKIPSYPKTSYSLQTGAKLPIPMKNVNGALDPEWETSDEGIARASAQRNSKGVKTGKALVEGLSCGNTTLTATIDGQKYNCTIYVTAPEINKKTMTLKVGKQGTVALKKTKIKKTDVIWKSDNPEVATVDANGKITALKSGNATIYTETGGIRNECYVTVP